MCYPLFVSRSKFIYPKIQIGGELRSNNSILYHFFFYRPLFTLVESILEQFYIGNKIIWIPKCTTLN